MAKSIKKFLKSFTLIELIIVIAIIVVLGTAAFLLLTQWLSKGRDAQRISDLSTIKTALDIALSKNDQLPLPDEAKSLLYSGTQILYQGKFGDDVVKSIGTLNKVPKDRLYGEYDFSLLDDMKTYKIMAVMENEQYKSAFVQRALASDDYYRYLGKDIKGVVVLDKFVYLPSMFITGYINNSYDLKGGSLNVFLGAKVGEVLTAGVASLDNNDIVAMLTGLGISNTDAVKIVDQTLPQSRVGCEGNTMTVNARSYEVGKLAHAQSSLVELSPIITTNGVVNYKQSFVCNNGTINVSGEEIAELVCNEGNINIAGECKVGLIGDNTAGRSWSDGTYATSCNKYKNPITGKNYAGATGNGVYLVDFGSSVVKKVYCDMTTNGGGRSVVFNSTAYSSYPETVNNMFVSTLAGMDSGGIKGGALSQNYRYNVHQLGASQMLYSVSRNDCSLIGHIGFWSTYNSVTYWAGILDGRDDTKYKYNGTFISNNTCSQSYNTDPCRSFSSSTASYSNITATFPSSTTSSFQIYAGKNCAGSRISLLMIR